MNTLAVFDLSSTARTAGLGMDYLALFDNDLTIGIDNPSMLRAIMNGTGVLSFVPMFDGSNMGTLAYAHTFEHIGTMSFGFRFFNYGRFHGYDEEENYEGDFGAGDYSLVIGWGMWIDSNFSIGVNFKPVLSQYESYTAFAQAFDLSGSYSSDDRRFAGHVVGNERKTCNIAFCSGIFPYSEREKIAHIGSQVVAIDRLKEIFFRHGSVLRIGDQKLHERRLAP